MSTQAIQEHEPCWDELIVLHRAQEYWVERRQRLRTADMRKTYLTTKIKTCRQRSTAIETQLIILNAEDVNVDEKRIFTLSQERYDIQKGLQDKLNNLNNIDASIKACWHEGGQKMRDVWHEDAPPQYEPEMQPQTWFKTSSSVREVPRRPASALDHFAANKSKHVVIPLRRQSPHANGIRLIGRPYPSDRQHKQQTSRSAIDLLAGGSTGRNFKVGGSGFSKAFES